MTLDDLWKLTRRYLLLILVGCLTGLGAAVAWLVVQPKEYTSTAVGYVTAGGGSTVGESFTAQSLAQQKARSYVPLFTSRSVAETVIKDLGLEVTPESLASKVSAVVPEDGVQISVSAVGSTPTEARDVANAVVKATAQEAKRLEEAGPAQERVGPDGKTQRVEPSAVVLIRPTETAVLPTRPSAPNPTRVLPLGLLLGLLGSYAIAAARHRSDTRLRHVEDVEQAAGASVLGVLPASSELSLGAGVTSGSLPFHERESLRKLRTNLRFVNIDDQPRSIVVTSAHMGEGKSTVASSLATVLAESGESVVLVDADLRRPAVARAFDADDSVGLTQVLVGAISLEDALQPTDHLGLHLLTAGPIPPNPSELLGSHRMEDLVREMSETYMVILDAPPLLPVTDAALLTRNADGAVLVVAAGKTRKEEVERAATALTAVGGKVLGAVMNRASTGRMDRFRYGDVQYGDAYQKSYSNTYTYEPEAAGSSRAEVRRNSGKSSRSRGWGRRSGSR